MDVIESQGVKLELHGSEYKGLCPFHDDHNPSLNVNKYKQVFFCASCEDKKGDIFDFLMAMGNTLPQSIAILKGESTSAKPAKRAHTNVVKTLQWSHILATTAPTLNQFAHYKHGEPSKTYRYNLPTGQCVGYVCRFEVPDGKETLPFVFAKNGSSHATEWKYLGFQNPYRPLYNADLIASNPSATIVLVEGEKCADFINELLPAPEFVATTWVGGAGQVGKTSLDQLINRDIVFWPDNDEAGEKCMRYAMSQIAAKSKRYIIPSAELPPHWDAADSGFSIQQLRDYIIPPPEVLHTQDETHFKYLGYQKEEKSPKFIFYVNRSRNIQRLTAAEMTKSNLTCLAPLSWWERKYFPFKNTDSATSSLVETSYAVGLYSPKNIRGRGAWYDAGRIVIHAGNKLIVDGVETKLGDLKTTFIYEIGESFSFNTENPISSDEAGKLLEITKLLNFDRDVNAYLLAGWCVMAPVCGAMKWRPHIWLTGPAGSGKSWVFRDIVRPLLGETSLSVQGATTEAGLRQSLGFDAKPVVFDEIDGNDRKSQDRIQEILELARSASADDTGLIVKGSAGHQAKEFQIRSCFAFASIGVGADKGSDKRRITTLTMTTLQDEELRGARWTELKKLHTSVITDQFVMGLHARTIGLLPIILKNSHIFTAAVSIVLGTQAMGDQIGPMLAGAYSLVGDDIISLDNAIDWIRDQNWTEEESTEAIKDEQELLHTVMQWMVDVDAFGKRTVYELVNLSADIEKVHDEMITKDIAYKRLRRMGIKTKNNNIIVCANNVEINKRLSETRWAKNYAKILTRIPGSIGKPSRFTGKPEWAIHIPIEGLFA